MRAIGLIHLRQVVESSAADLLPRHRTLQLVAAGLILAAHLIWPMLLTNFLGVPALITLAAYLSFICLTLWLAFFFENGLLATLGILTIVWVFVDLYRLFSPVPETSRVSQLGTYVGSSSTTFLIAASSLGIIAFVFYYQRLSSARCYDGSGNYYQVSLRTGDWVDPLTVRAAAKRINRMFEAGTSQGPSLCGSARLFQFGLFSPSYSAGSYVNLGVFFTCALLTYMSFHQESRSDFPPMNFFLPFGYYWIMAMLAADFLSHRNRMAAIYLQSRLPSRDTFARATVLSYLLVVSKHALIITAAAILLHLILPWTTWTNFPQLCVMGFTLSLIQVALSLLASDKVKSSGGISWLMCNLFLVLPVVFVGRAYVHSWSVVAVLALAGGLLFWLAVRRWTQTEMDFAVT